MQQGLEPYAGDLPDDDVIDTDEMREYDWAKGEYDEAALLLQLDWTNQGSSSSLSDAPGLFSVRSQPPKSSRKRPSERPVWLLK